MTISILIADDHHLVRHGLRRLLERELDMKVVGEAADGDAAVQQAAALAPDVIVMDVAMPGPSGADATQRICERNPAAKVIALSMHADRRFVVGMLEAHASGYLLKECAFDELVHAIHAVVAGHMYLSPAITHLIVKEYLACHAGDRTSSSGDLSTREWEILRLLAEGKPTKETARLLHLSIKTVEAVRNHLKEKLELNSVAELTKFAIREGLTTIE